MKTWYCDYCGYTNNSDRKTCRQCGRLAPFAAYWLRRWASPR